MPTVQVGKVQLRGRTRPEDLNSTRTKMVGNDDEDEKRKDEKFMYGRRVQHGMRILRLG